MAVVEKAFLRIFVVKMHFSTKGSVIVPTVFLSTFDDGSGMLVG